MAIYVARIYKNGLNRPNAFINELNSKTNLDHCERIKKSSGVVIGFWILKLLVVIFAV